MSDLNLEGMALAEGVLDTIVALALQDVEGIALPSNATPAGLLGSLTTVRPGLPRVDARTLEDGTVEFDVHVAATNGTVLPDLAQRVRSAVSDAVLAQVGIEVPVVNVFIDSIQF